MDSSPPCFPLDFENYFKAEDYSFEYRSFGSFHICCFGHGPNRIHLLPNPNSDIADKIHSVLAHNQLVCPSNFLCQFWTAVIREDRCLLTTRKQTFVLNFGGDFKDGLCEYRMICNDYECDVDSDVEEGRLGILGRVFRYKSIEATPNMEYYTIQQYPLRDVAQSCGIKSLVAIPVFEPSKLCCVGVLELVSTYDYPSFPIYFICEELQEVGLKPPVVIANHWKRKYEKTETVMLHAKNEIMETFKASLKIPKVRLCRAWAPCTSCNNVFNGDIMMGVLCDEYEESTFDSPSHLLYMLAISLVSHLQKGQGIVGRAVSSGMLTLYTGINKLNITDDPLAHFARYNGFNGCLAIPLQSNHIEHNVYVLEFFFEYSEDPCTFLHKILENMKKYLLSFKVTFGQELRGNLQIIVIDSQMNEKCDFIQILEKEELVQHSVMDAIITGRNDVIWEQSSILNSIQRVDERASIQQSLMDAMATRKNNLSQDPNDISHFIQVLGERGSMHQPSMDAMTLGMGDVNKESNNLLSSCSKQGRAIDVVRIEHTELGIPIGTSNMNEPQATDGEVVQQCLLSQPLENLVDNLTNDAGGNPNGTINSNLQETGTIVTTGKQCRKSGIPITLEDIQQQFGKKLEYAAASLNISRSTLKRACREYGILWWRPGKRHSGHHVANNASNEDVPQDQVLPPNPNLLHQPHGAIGISEMQNYIPLENTNTINVKVMVSDKLAIKFQLSSSSKIARLKEEVVKRWNGIDFENYNFQYQDEENDWILIRCDDDLHHFLSSSTLSTKTSVIIYLKPFKFPV